MTDPDLVAKKLALIETYVHELKTLADASRIDTDIRELRFVEHTLQIAVQAALDVASHVVSDERWGEPRTNQDSSSCSPGTGGSTRICRARCGRWSASETWSFTGMSSVNTAIVRDVLENHLDDLTAFVAAVRTRITA